MGEQKVNGRKRPFWVNANGCLLRVLVHAATISDTEGAIWLLQAYYTVFPRIQEVRVATGAKAGLSTWMQQHTTMKRATFEKPAGQRGCAIGSRRWVVERSIAWAGRSRVDSKEYHRTPEASEACIYLASIRMLLNRLYPKK